MSMVDALLLGMFAVTAFLLGLFVAIIGSIIFNTIMKAWETRP